MGILVMVQLKYRGIVLLIVLEENNDEVKAVELK